MNIYSFTVTGSYESRYLLADSMEQAVARAEYDAAKDPATPTGSRVQSVRYVGGLVATQIEAIHRTNLSTKKGATK